MRLILEVTSGPPHTRRKTVMRADQTLSVGGSEWAAFCCDFDQKMSSVHFTLKTDALGCYLSDHTSRDGTFFNDMKATDCIRRDGDRIEAGSPRFVVHVEGDSPEEPRSMHGANWAPTDLASGIIDAAKGTLNHRSFSEP